MGQAEIPVLLALDTAKRRPGRQGSSLTNWAPSEQRGEWLPGREGAHHMERFFLRGMAHAADHAAACKFGSTPLSSLGRVQSGDKGSLLGLSRKAAA